MCVDLHPRVVQDIQEGARVACIYTTTLAAGTRDSGVDNGREWKLWLAGGGRAEVEARDGKPACHCKKLHLVWVTEFSLQH